MKTLVILSLIIVLTGFVNAGFGYTDTNGPMLSPATTTSGGNSTYSNSSEYWDTNLGALDDVNSTQFSNNGGVLNILESWIDSLWCRLTGCTMSGDLVLEDETVGISNSDSSTRIIFDTNGTQWVEYT